MNEISIIVYKKERTNKEKGTKFYTYYTKIKDNKNNVINTSVKFSPKINTTALSPYPIDVNAVLKYKTKIITSDFSLPKYGYQPYEIDGKKHYPYIYINDILQVKVLEENPPKHEDKNEWYFVAEEEEKQPPKALNSDMVENLNIDKVKDMFDDVDISIKY